MLKALRADPERRYQRRNRALVAAASPALVAVVGGSAASAVQSRRALYEQRVNVAVSDYMLSLFRSPDGPVADNRALTVADVTERGARRAETELAGQPEAQAEVYRIIAEVYLSVGRTRGADSIASLSVDLWEKGHSAAAARSRTVQGLALHEHGDRAHAEGVLARALDDLLASGSSRRGDVASARAALAEVVAERDRAAEAKISLR